jgi:kumamolisin
MLLIAGSLAHAQAAPAPVQMPGSIAPVDPAPPAAGQTSPHGAYITRRALQASESAAPITFEVALKMHNFAELQARVAHGARISPQEMAAKYQPTAAEYAQVTAWLASQGFTVTRREKSHLAVFAQGTVAQVQTATQATFARVSNGSAEYTSAITAPSVPAALAPLLVGINGLQPHLQYHKHFIARKNSLTGNNPPYLPSQIAQAYNASPLYTSSITGSGQAIAIVIDTFPNTTDLTSFWSTCSISQSLGNITLINVTGNTLPSPSGEETLDTEWSSSIAYGAKVRVYAASSLEFTDIDQAYSQVYDDASTTPSLNINQLSMSYGLGEVYEGSSQLQTDDQLFTSLTAVGVGLFASSGDAGATPNSEGQGGGIEQVEAPSSDPNVTGVGGTSLILASSGNTEVVWNDSYGASGGGNSQYFSKPSWQVGNGVPNGSVRYVPDISGSADPNEGGLVILNGAQYQYGGTSWSSPTWAAFCALINQSRANVGAAGMGQLAPQLYPYIGSANFRDITSGNNKFDSRRGYTAATGYDRCTGIGVPNVQGLATALTPVPGPPSITNGPATATGEVSVAYSFTYTTSGFPTPTFSLVSGSELPSGITLSTAGVLTGTPTQSGVFTGTATATNGNSPDATQAYSLTIDQAPAILNGPPTATTLVNTAYSFTYSASGYPTPTFSATGLPTGLTISSAGAITGTATLGGSYTGTVTATNGVSPDATQAFTIAVDQPPAFTSAPINLSTDDQTASNIILQASGYPAPTFSVTAGSLPPGMTLSSNGVLTGTPTAAGTFTGTFDATNSIGSDAMQTFSITVTIVTNVDTPTLPPWGLPVLGVALVFAAARLSPKPARQRSI